MRDTSKSIWYTGQPFEMVVLASVVVQQNYVAVLFLWRAVRLNLAGHCWLVMNAGWTLCNILN